MQIKVITRHTPNNYGSLLQSIATLRVIESLGHQCEIIDYWKRDEVGLQGILTSLQGKSLSIAAVVASMVGWLSTETSLPRWA